MAEPRIDYNPNPSVPISTGVPKNYLSTRANANDFGAQVGEANQRLGQAQTKVGQAQSETGKVFGDIGNDLAALAIHKQGIINESIVTNADTQANLDYTTITGKYKNMQGLEAINNLEGVTKDVLSVRQKIRASLPNSAAQRSFDLLSVRSERFALSDIHNYGNQQLKVADNNASQASLKLSIDQAGSPTVAFNEDQFGHEIGNIKFQAARATDNQGYGPDAGTGMQQLPNGDVTFDDTPQGNQAKVIYEQYVNTALGQAWDNRVKTVAFDPQQGNVDKAVRLMEEHKDQIPAATYAKLSLELSAPYKAEQGRNIAVGEIGKWNQNYNDLYNNNKESIPNATQDTPRISNIITSVFPGSVITSTNRTPEHNAEVGGVSNSMHLSDKAIDFVAPEGTSLEEVRNQLHAHGINPTELINEGDHFHIGWGDKDKPQLGYMSKADYYSVNWDNILSDVRQNAATQGFDLGVQDQAVSRAEQYMRQSITAQDQAIKISRGNVIQAINGDDKNPPMVLMDQLDSTADPKLRQDWLNIQMNDPYLATNIRTRLIPANARGQTTTYGTQFYDALSASLTGNLHEVSKFYNMIDPNAGDKSPLTVAGTQALQKIVDWNKTPDGVAFAGQTRTFLEDVKKNMTSSITGMRLPELDEKFNKSLQYILPQIVNGKSKGLTAAQMFDPKSSEYIGKNIQYPTAAEQAAALKTHALNTIKTRNQERAEQTFSTYDDLKKSYREGKIDRAGVETYLTKNNLWDKPGWVNKPGPPVPLPN